MAQGTLMGRLEMIRLVQKHGKQFSVYQFFNTGDNECVRYFVDIIEASRAFDHYTNNVAVHMGIVKRVIMTDGGDCICREWRLGEGIIDLVKEYPERGAP